MIHSELIFCVYYEASIKAYVFSYTDYTIVPETYESFSLKNNWSFMWVSFWTIVSLTYIHYSILIPHSFDYCSFILNHQSLSIWSTCVRSPCEGLFLGNSYSKGLVPSLLLQPVPLESLQPPYILQEVEVHHCEHRDLQPGLSWPRDLGIPARWAQRGKVEDEGSLTPRHFGTHSTLNSGWLRRASCLPGAQVLAASWHGRLGWGCNFVAASAQSLGPLSLPLTLDPWLPLSSWKRTQGTGYMLGLKGDSLQQPWLWPSSVSSGGESEVGGCYNHLPWSHLGVC